MDANPRAATDAEIAWLRELLSTMTPIEREHWCADRQERILNRLAAVEKENADLRAKVDQAVGLLRRYVQCDKTETDTKSLDEKLGPVFDDTRAFLATLNATGEGE